MSEFEFENENIYQPDGNLQHINRKEIEELSIRCPHCLHVGTFATAVDGLVWAKYQKNQSRTRGRNMKASLRVCPNSKCHGIIMTISSGSDFTQVLPPELIDFEAEGLPIKLLATLREAVSCHAAGAYRASAMMVRRLLEEICEESGATGKDLHARLISLRTKITLPEELFEAMGELKALGNDAAHITAKNYTEIGKDESEDSIELSKEILKARYQLKGLLDRLRARKNRNNSLPDSL